MKFLKHNEVREEQDQSEPPLWKEILRFKKFRLLTVIILLIIGVSGIILPVIPGLLFLFFAFALFKPGMMAKIRNKIKQWRSRSGDY